MNQELLEQVLRSPRLPSLPTIALEVIELVQQKDVNIKQIANTISHDPALATKILRTVNSSFYGQTQTISTITHALVILGLNSVKTLALGFSLVSNLKDSGAGGDFDHVTFWKRSLLTAVAGRSLAREFGVLQQEEAFLGGLLQDLGVLAMAQALGPKYTQIVAEAAEDHSALGALERDQLGADHAEVGAALAEAWKLPPVLAIPIRYHESPDAAPSEIQPIVRCVALGNRVADVFITENPAALEQYYHDAAEWFGVTRERAEPILERIHTNTVEMHRLFNLPMDSLGNAQDILARANDALLNLSLQQAQKSTELEERNRLLAEEAITDSLTGVANRRKFNESMAQEFAAAHATGKPLTILFFDADHFKKFNDTYGHQIGDRVLVELAQMLKKAAPTGLVARYGGEEFAIVVPATDRVTGAALAERIRALVAATPIVTDDGQSLSITVSIGVATYCGDIFERVEQLLKAADQGVYAAKAAGRNCVRVFTPRLAKTATAA
ncbi:MAG: GGDEF domain-containing protein [Phycisphaeraceae bacterium]